MPHLTLTVNGTTRSLDVPHSRTLAQVLRYDLGLTGAKIGCNEAECGACTVLVNSRGLPYCPYSNKRLGVGVNLCGKFVTSDA